MSKKNRSGCPVNKTSIGGQALMEGIMMRGPKKTAMAVRQPNGDIILEDWKNQSAKRPKICKLPIIRGVVGFVDSLVTGYKCLMRSAEIAVLEDVVEKKDDTEDQRDSNITVIEGNGPVPGYMLSGINESDSAKKSGEDAKDSVPDSEASSKETSKDDEKLSRGAWDAMMIVSVAIALVLCVGLFVLLPSFLYILFSGIMLKANPGNVLFLPDLTNVGKWSWRVAGQLFGTQYATVDTVAIGAGTLALRSLIKSAFEGVFKILLLVGYMAAITLMKDIRRTFMYHGAEHKTIFCYEKGLELTVENVRKQKRFHPRCGTSFLILMLLVSVFISFLIDPLCVLIVGKIPALAIRAVIKICLIPLIMGVGYELLKFAGRHDNWLTKIISAPGVALQHITVLEPTDDMIECAIASVKKVIPDDGSDKW